MKRMRLEAVSPSLRFTLLIGVVWTLFLAGVFAWSWRVEHDQTLRVTTAQTRVLFRKFLLTRFWNAMHGGVYVPVSKDTPSNPYLQVENRDVVTMGGVQLTLLNPAYMTRQIADIAEQSEEFFFHLTSLDPINPENRPDSWEKEALEHFAEGATEHYGMVEQGPGKTVFRFMAPLTIEEPCLQCHDVYGDRVGDPRGGISVAIDATPILAASAAEIQHAGIVLAVIWLLGIMGLVGGGRRLHRLEGERNLVVEQLRASLAEIKLLGGLLPICCQCKKIRDDQGYWKQVEQYIEQHTAARFSHGLCPDCAQELYPEAYQRLVRMREHKKEEENS